MIDYIVILVNAMQSAATISALGYYVSFSEHSVGPSIILSFLGLVPCMVLSFECCCELARRQLNSVEKVRSCLPPWLGGPEAPAPVAQVERLEPVSIPAHYVERAEPSSWPPFYLSRLWQQALRARFSPCMERP